MAVKVAIMGSDALAAWCFAPSPNKDSSEKDVDVVAVGDIVPADNLAYLLKYDSTQGRFKGEVARRNPRRTKPKMMCSS